MGCWQLWETIQDYNLPERFFSILVEEQKGLSLGSTVR